MQASFAQPELSTEQSFQVNEQIKVLQTFHCNN